MRKKIIEMDGAKFTIAPLNLDQVDEFFNMEKTVLLSKDEINKHALTVIAAALNNAGPDVPYTHEQLRRELDLVLSNKLYMETLAFSGLKATEGSGAAGEAGAVSVN